MTDSAPPPVSRPRPQHPGGQGSQPKKKNNDGWDDDIIRDADIVTEPGEQQIRTPFGKPSEASSFEPQKSAPQPQPPSRKPPQPQPQPTPTPAAVTPAPMAEEPERTVETIVETVVETTPTETTTTIVETAPQPSVITNQRIRSSAQSLLDYIADDECSEVLTNGPNEVLRKVKGSRWHCAEISFGDPDTYHQVINEVILPYCDTPDRIDGTKVVVEGQLEIPGTATHPPMLARVHIICPPGVPYAKMTIAKKPRIAITLDDMVAGGSLSGDAAEFLKAISRGHKTFVVSGATGAGKTTLLQAMTHYFDMNDRVVVVEETPELRLPLGDVVYLKASLELPGMPEAEIFTVEFWVKQSMRMRMDRVIVGESRGPEMQDWLLAANSGAEGSCTTVHANSPRRALDKILSLSSKNLVATSELQLRRDIAATVDIIIQASLVDGRHVVTAIEEVSGTVSDRTGQIQTNTLFAFDRHKNTHVVKGRPSDALSESLALQGVPLNPAWFRQQ